MDWLLCLSLGTGLTAMSGISVCCLIFSVHKVSAHASFGLIPEKTTLRSTVLEKNLADIPAQSILLSLITMTLGRSLALQCAIWRIVNLPNTK